MYESFYGMKEKTFNLNPDPDYLYMSQGHEKVYTHLEYAICENKGFVVITGEIGSGKTTLINYLLYNLQLDIQIGLVNNTNIAPSQFLRMICQEYELDVSGRDKVEAMEIFQDFLIKKFTDNNRVLLIIDEAQNLSPKTMEEIRMLSNLETEKNHLIQIILVGQPELKYKLQRKDLQQFAQRVTVHCHLDGLSRKEVGEYIQHRLKVGEAKNPDLFHNEAIEVIYKNSGGIPRLINILCDTSLVYGYADGLKIINKKVVENVVKERKESGIFSDLNISRQDDPSVLPMQFPDSGISDNRLQLVEKRIEMLEKTTVTIEEKMNDLITKRRKRDTIVIELFKMLKNSLESRMNVISKIDKLKIDERNVSSNMNISVVKK